ncbi:basic leucine zipper 43-like protein [Tanacetum coccineum]
MAPQISQFQYLTPQDNSINFYIQDPISVLDMTDFVTNIPDQYFSSNPSSLSNTSSTSDETDEQQISILSERKRRRMVSNRESARRSRVRKQKHLDELLAQMARLRSDNLSLVEHLNNLLESHERAVDENARLKEETTDIKRKLDELQLAY